MAVQCIMIVKAMLMEFLQESSISTSKCDEATRSPATRQKATAKQVGASHHARLYSIDASYLSCSVYISASLSRNFAFEDQTGGEKQVLAN